MSVYFARARVSGSASVAAREGSNLLRSSLAGKDPKLVLAFASTKQPLNELLPALQTEFPSAVVVGAGTAGEFTETGDSVGQVVFAAIAGALDVSAGFAENLTADVDGAVTSAVHALAAPTRKHRTALLFFDGLCGVGEEVTLLTAAHLGDEVQVAGAAAGDDWAVEKTHVGLGNKASTNALVLVQLCTDVKLGVGVRHGHRPFGPAVRVTKSEGSVVTEFDGRPAWQVFSELTQDECKTVFGRTPEELSHAGDRLRLYARCQTAIRSGGEYRNRTPLARTPNDGLAYACGIPVGTELQMMRSTPSEQIESAALAAQDARNALGGGPVAGALVFDCGCRKVFLGEEFSKATESISKTLGGAPIAGFESYGEVALVPGDFSGFHNTTSVVLALPE